MSESDFSDEKDVSKRSRQKRNKHEKPEKNKDQKKRSHSLESNDERNKKKKRKSRNQSHSGDELLIQESAKSKRDKKDRNKTRKEGKQSDYESLPEHNERKKTKKDKWNDYKDDYERSPNFGKIDKKTRHKTQSNQKDQKESRDKVDYSDKFDEEEDKEYNKSSSKSKKYSKDDRSYSIKKNKKRKDNDGEEDPSKNRQRKDEGFEDSPKYSDRKTKENKRSTMNRHDKDSGRGETETLDEDEDDAEKDQGSDKPFRYWSSSRGPVRKNSDSYWNKYADRLKEKESNSEIVEVGPRYYSASDSSRRDRKKDDVSDNLKNNNDENDTSTPEVVKPPPKKVNDMLTTRTGGAYIPPAKLRMMQQSISDKSSPAYQRLAWEALKKSIQGHINKVNMSNIKETLKAVQKENIVRGRGLLCRSLIQSQAGSLLYTNVYAAFVAVLNAKFPKIGELLLKRLVVQFRRGFKRNDKTICITAATFIAHLVNQEVAHEILALEMLTLLIETPTDDSVEVAIAFLKECGMKLTEVSSKGVLAIFDMLRNILHEGKLEKRVQYMIEVMFQVRKEDFKAHPSIAEGLDLVEEEDRIQHMITLEDNHDAEEILNVFKLDPNYEENEAKYKSLVEIDSGEDSDEDGSGSSGSGESDDESEAGAGENEGNKEVIVDRTETNLVALRKTIYLTIQSSLDFEECAHKLLRMELKPGQEIEMAHMFLDCCAEQRTYEKFYGLLSQRFCQINRSYIAPFEETFRDSYSTVHRMSNDKLRNVGKLFAHLLFTDAISWEVLSTIRLNEDETTSSSRIFIKILFLELSEYMGLAKLNQRVKDPSLQTALEGLFPRDNPKHTRFAINFFTSIGLGGLTDELREHLKTQPKPSAVPQLVEGLSSSSSSSDSSSDSSDSSSSSSSDSSSDSEEESSNKKKKSKATSKSKKQKKQPESKKSAKKQKNSSPKRKRDR